jgi:hypothetical protein
VVIVGAVEAVAVVEAVEVAVVVAVSVLAVVVVVVVVVLIHRMAKPFRLPSWPSVWPFCCLRSLRLAPRR